MRLSFFFWFKELLNTRAGASVRSLPRELYEMLEGMTGRGRSNLSEGDKRRRGLESDGERECERDGASV